MGGKCLIFFVAVALAALERLTSARTSAKASSAPLPILSVRYPLLQKRVKGDKPPNFLKMPSKGHQRAQKGLLKAQIFLSPQLKGAWAGIPQ